MSNKNELTKYFTRHMTQLNQIVKPYVEMVQKNPTI